MMPLSGFAEAITSMDPLTMCHTVARTSIIWGCIVGILVWLALMTASAWVWLNPPRVRCAICARTVDDVRRDLRQSGNGHGDVSQGHSGGDAEMTGAENLAAIYGDVSGDGRSGDGYREQSSRSTAVVTAKSNQIGESEDPWSIIG